MALIFVLVLLLVGNGQVYAQDIEAASENPFSISGSVGVRGVGYAANGIASRRVPLSYVLSGSVTATIYDVSLPFSFTFSEQDRSFSQPFNQFGLSPRYKWITLHGGFRNLTFSPFTLAGHQFLGAGLELNPGEFRFAAMYGRFVRAVEEDTTSEAFIQPTFSRTGYAARIGYGTEESHLDLILLKAADDTTSLTRVPVRTEVLPAENLVLGASGKLSLFNVLSLNGEFAVSNYARDIRAEQLKTSDDISFLDGIIPTRMSTQVYTALQLGMSLNLQPISLMAMFSRVDPDYRSMGAYFFNNDLQTISITPTYSSPDQTFRLSATFLQLTDNLQNKKQATTTRTAPTVNISFNPEPAFGLDVMLSATITDQKKHTEALADSMLMSQVNPVLSISPRLMLGDTSIQHMVTATVMYQELIDNNESTAPFSGYSTLNAFAAYSLMLQESGLTLNGSANFTQLINFSGETYNAGFSAGFSKAFMNNDFVVTASSGVSLMHQGTAFNISAGASYRLSTMHAFEGNVYYMNTGNDGFSPAFSEITGILAYTLTF